MSLRNQERNHPLSRRLHRKPRSSSSSRHDVVRWGLVWGCPIRYDIAVAKEYGEAMGVCSPTSERRGYVKGMSVLGCAASGAKLMLMAVYRYELSAAALAVRPGRTPQTEPLQAQATDSCHSYLGPRPPRPYLVTLFGPWLHCCNVVRHCGHSPGTQCTTRNALVRPGRTPQPQAPPLMPRPAAIVTCNLTT